MIISFSIIEAPHREFQKEILQAMRVGVGPTQRISTRNSTGNEIHINLKLTSYEKPP